MVFQQCNNASSNIFVKFIAVLVFGYCQSVGDVQLFFEYTSKDRIQMLI